MMRAGRDRRPRMVVPAEHVRPGDEIVTPVGNFTVTYHDINTDKPAPHQVCIKCGETWTSFYFKSEDVTIIRSAL